MLKILIHTLVVIISWSHTKYIDKVSSTDSTRNMASFWDSLNNLQRINLSTNWCKCWYHIVMGHTTLAKGTTGTWSEIRLLSLLHSQHKTVCKMGFPFCQMQKSKWIWPEHHKHASKCFTVAYWNPINLESSILLASKAAQARVKQIIWICHHRFRSRLTFMRKKKEADSIALFAPVQSFQSIHLFFHNRYGLKTSLIKAAYTEREEKKDCQG